MTIRILIRALLFPAAVFIVLARTYTAEAQVPAGLEAFMSYTFHDELVAAERGDRIAWVETRKGVRNLWMAAGPDFRPRQVTRATGDDGQALTGLVWSPDGSRIVWVRGGDHGRNPWAAGLPPPNPASASEKPELDIWSAPASGGKAVKLAEGDAPALSATGRIAYIKNGEVWTVGGDGKPGRLFYDRGRVEQLVWSPDGSRMAFVSRREDHSFIGVYTRPEKPVLWLAPSTGWDNDPVWSPDGERIAFSRVSGVSDVVFSMLTEKPRPFAIMVASAADGSASEAWRSPGTPEGSLPTVPDGLNLMWGAGDRLTFRAELDGWPHLYSLPATGGTPQLLTPGKFMVEHVAMSADRRTLFYSANAGPDESDIDRRHLFRVAVDHPGPVALTSGAGLEWTPVPVGNTALAYVSVTATTPTRIMLADTNGKGAQSLDISGADFAARGMTVPRHITFTAPDGLVIHGQLFTSPGGAARKPGVIFVHGGPSRQMLLGWAYRGYYAHSYALNQYLASRGFVVLSVNYRLGIGYGRAFQHASRAGLAGSSEYQDVLAGARFLQALPDVDPARIGIWGGSYGGYLTALALGRDSDTFKAGVDLHGVHDWTHYTGRVPQPKRFEQGDYAAAIRSAFENSPVAHLETWRSPVLLIHGDADGNVPFSQTTDLARRLAARGVPYEELILPNEIHGFLRYDSWLKADMATVRFLEEKLRP